MQTKTRGKRTYHILMTEVEADAGKEAKCIFFLVGNGNKKQKCGVPLPPSFAVTYNDTDIPGDWLDMTYTAP